MLALVSGSPRFQYDDSIQGLPPFYNPGNFLSACNKPLLTFRYYWKQNSYNNPVKPGYPAVVLYLDRLTSMYRLVK